MTAEGLSRTCSRFVGLKLTLGAAERKEKKKKRRRYADSDSGLRVAARDLFLVRPETPSAYGLEARGAGALGRLPAVRELFVNGAFTYLGAFLRLRRKQRDRITER